MKKMAYIVTEGEYSDYRILAVFENKDKAEEYIKMLKKRDRYCYSGPIIEEYRFGDDNLTTINDYVRYDLSWCVSTTFGIERLSFEDITDSLIDDLNTNDTLVFNSFRFNQFLPYTVAITRHFKKGTITEEQAKKKMTKMAYDITAEIHDLKAQGADDDDIEKAIEAKYNRGDNE